MSANTRGEFSSSLGFIMAAAGSAIGLGNIWGFPSQAAKNGGAAFVVVYLILAFLIAFPALMAELIIGRHARANAVGAFQTIKGGKNFIWAGVYGMFVAGLVLSFYSIVAGWMVSHVFEPALTAAGANTLAGITISKTLWPNIIFTSVFYIITILIITGGVKEGIEKWSTRLMPSLLAMLILLIGYVVTLEGAGEGLQALLVPDFTKITNPSLILSALGQAFFSLSLGVGTMLVYGSYIGRHENLVKLGVFVTLADIGIAFLAGLLIIPAMYVAKAKGTQIFDESGALIEGDKIAFEALPQLFDSMGPVGVIVAVLFFLLMTVASVTSSISMLEVPVSYAVDNLKMNRKKATWIIGGLFWAISLLIIFNFELLFGFVIQLTTQYSQPLLGLIFCIFIGWVMNRNEVLMELKQGMDGKKYSTFFKIWSVFVKFITPALILLVFIQSVR